MRTGAIGNGNRLPRVVSNKCSHPTSAMIKREKERMLEKERSEFFFILGEWISGGKKREIPKRCLSVR